MIKTKKKGNISLTTVLITSAVLLIMGSILLITMTDYSKSSNEYFNNELNEVQVKGCIEESVQKIKSNNSYAGTFTVDYPNGNCSIQIIIVSSDLRNVIIESTYNNFKTIIHKRVDLAQSPYAISNY